ncbi:MAG: hypothetical protein E5V75_08970 [Mesorhizobium sp.]|nr:MAG: hypothetical protein E5V75_08970 [Mesorhizobium sp.]
MAGLFSFAVGSGIMVRQAMPVKSRVQLPLHKITFTLPEDTKDAFFRQLRQFADTYGFAIRIAPITPDGEQFGVQMYQESIKLLGDNALDTKEVFIGFYQQGENAVPAPYLTRLVDGLKQAVQAVPGVTVLKES